MRRPFAATSAFLDMPVVEQLAIAGGNAVFSLAAAAVLDDRTFVTVSLCQLGAGAAAGALRTAISEGGLAVSASWLRRGVAGLVATALVCAAIGVLANGSVGLALAVTSAVAAVGLYEIERPLLSRSGRQRELLVGAVAWGAGSVVLLYLIDRAEGSTALLLLAWSLPTLLVGALWARHLLPSSLARSRRSVRAAVTRVGEFSINAATGPLVLATVAWQAGPGQAVDFRLATVLLGTLTATALSHRVRSDDAQTTAAPRGEWLLVASLTLTSLLIGTFAIGVLTERDILDFIPVVMAALVFRLTMLHATLMVLRARVAQRNGEALVRQSIAFAATLLILLLMLDGSSATLIAACLSIAAAVGLVFHWRESDRARLTDECGSVS